MSITSMTTVAGDTRLQPAVAMPKAPPAQSSVEGSVGTETAKAVSAPAAASATAAQAEQPTTMEQVQQAMDEVRKAITPVAQDLLFSIDEDTGKTIVKVVDASTDEVIRQIPSEEIISIAKAIDKLQGLLVQQKA
ncbi:flagellar protein FlaG [Azoarcus olearius]|uniref:Probable flagellar protein n=1 Tax=Azoarcus sp. (strain BH72) TaxID=418699 RepID=A1K916_AZOSB|nr:flagellar protein FlaG [Azoarcus olearius]ANQ85868.1 flagellar protein [Azoarcus olearius]CAL95321.1 probable flagellar protein [Azoarcus olearius]